MKQLKFFYCERPHPLLVEILWVGHSRDTLGLGTPATQGHSGVGHSMETLGLGTSGTVWCWALQWGWALRGLGHSRAIQGLRGQLNKLDWALQKDSGEHSGHILELSTWALQGNSKVGHSRETLGLGTPGEELSSKSSNPTPRVGKYRRVWQAS